MIDTDGNGYYEREDEQTEQCEHHAGTTPAALVDGGWGSAAGHNCYGPGRASTQQQCDIIKATPRGMSNILPLEENNAWLWNIRK